MIQVNFCDFCHENLTESRIVLIPICLDCSSNYCDLHFHEICVEEIYDRSIHRIREEFEYIFDFPCLYCNGISIDFDTMMVHDEEDLNIYELDKLKVFLSHIILVMNRLL